MIRRSAKIKLTVFSNKDVLWLQVSIDDLLRVQMTESEADLHSEELSLVLWELSDLNQMAEELSSLDKWHEEIDTELVLEHIFHINQERMVYAV